MNSEQGWLLLEACDRGYASEVKDLPKTGIPLTKSGRQRKVGRMMTGGGCLCRARCSASRSPPLPLLSLADRRDARVTRRPTIASMAAELEDAWSELHDAKPPDWLWAGPRGMTGGRYRSSTTSIREDQVPT